MKGEISKSVNSKKLNIKMYGKNILYLKKISKKMLLILSVESRNEWLLKFKKTKMTFPRIIFTKVQLIIFTIDCKDL